MLALHALPRPTVLTKVSVYFLLVVKANAGTVFSISTTSLSRLSATHPNIFTQRTSYGQTMLISLTISGFSSKLTEKAMRDYDSRALKVRK